MHDQSGGAPAEPPRNVPPPPGYSPVQGPQQPPGARWYPPTSPGYVPLPPPARRSRAGLWIALGVIGGLLAGGVAYGLTAGSSTAPRKSKSAAAAPGGSGNGSDAGSGNADQQAPDAGSRPLAKLTLPDSFMGLIRNDDDEAAQLMREQSLKATSKHSTATVYEGDEGSGNVIMVLAIEADGRTSDEDGRQFMAQQWLPTDSPYMSTAHGPISTIEPGPFGGTLQCAQSSVRTDATDVWGNHINNSVRCMWADANTYVDLTISPGVSGESVARGAAVARKFRDTIESRR